MAVDREPVSSVPPPTPPPPFHSAVKRKGSARSSQGGGKRPKVSLANARIELENYDAYE